jgi:hypothetical protein
MRATGKSKNCRWRWQERFAEEGVDGLLRDKTRPSRIPPLTQEVIDRVLAMTFDPPPKEATHWTGWHDGGGRRDQHQLGPAHLAQAQAAAPIAYASSSPPTIPRSPTSCATSSAST